MAPAIDMELVANDGKGSGSLLCRVRINDPELVGHDAVLTIEAEVEVKRSGGIDETKTLHSEKFKVQKGETEFRIPPGTLHFYSYAGKHIDLRVHTRVCVDDAIFFDTIVSEEQLIQIGAKPRLDTNAKEIIEPRDLFRFFANLKAIPPHNQIITLGLAIVGAFVMLINAVIGVHDQFVPEGATWIYSRYDSDGDTNHPLGFALISSGVVGSGVWIAIYFQLRKYMRFRLAKMSDRIERGVDYRVASFFTGRSRVPLENVILRIVACNMECGQYRERRGSDTVTVSFQEPVQGILLYEKRVSRIPANLPIADYFGDRLSFDLMFGALFPPAMISGSHGINVHWEIQLLHPEFVDRELVGPTTGFSYEDFLVA